MFNIKYHWAKIGPLETFLPRISSLYRLADYSPHLYKTVSFLMFYAQTGLEIFCCGKIELNSYAKLNTPYLLREREISICFPIYDRGLKNC